MKNDGVRSSLIEFQSFRNSKIDVNPKKLRLDASSMLDAGVVHDAVYSRRSHHDPCDLCP